MSGFTPEGVLGHRARRMVTAVIGITLLAVLLIVVPRSSDLAAAQVGVDGPDPTNCYGVGDEFGDPVDGVFGDALALINRDDPSVTQFIGETNTTGIEAIAFVPGSNILPGSTVQVLYAFDDAVLGTIDLTTGAWAALPAFPGLPADITDIDGLTYDRINGVLIATNRSGGDGNPDQIMTLDPATGAILSGPTDVEVATDPRFVTGDGAPYDDLDDIAVDPVDGTVYAIMNKGGEGGGLVSIDPVTAAVTYISLFNSPAGSPNMIADDLEGLAFFNNGLLYASSGANDPTNDDVNKFWLIDPSTGDATLLGEFASPVFDIEGLGCLTAPAFVDIEKATNGEDADVAPGPTINNPDNVVWTYVVTNVGDIPIDRIVITDDVEGEIFNQASGASRCDEGEIIAPGATLAVDAAITCTVTQPSTFEGQYTNMSTVAASYTDPIYGAQPEGILVDQDPSNYVGVAPPPAELTIVKTAVAGNGVDCSAVAPVPGAGDPVAGMPGDVVTFCITVTNIGGSPATNVVITDDNGTPADPADDMTWNFDSIDVGASETVSYERTLELIDGAPGLATNTAGASADGLPPVTDPAVVDVQGEPILGITKTAALGPNADCANVAPVAGVGDTLTADVGQTVTFCITVTNSGNAPATGVTISDDNGTPADPADDFSVDIGTLAPGESTSQSYDREITAAGTVVNTATVDSNELPPVTDPAEVFTGTPELTIVKTAALGPNADCANVAPVGGVGDTLTADVGQTVTFCITVANIGDGPATGVTITDDNGTPADPADDFTVNIGTLAAGAETTQSYDREIMAAGTVVNTASVSSNELPPVTDPAEVFTGTPELTIVKTAAVGPNADCANVAPVGGVGAPLDKLVGDTVTFCITVTNIGDGPATGVTITDDNGTPADPADDFTVDIGTLAAGAETTQSYDREITATGTVVNTATVDSNELPPVNDPAEVATGAPLLTIVKTVAPGPGADCGNVGAVAGLGNALAVIAGDIVTFCITVMNTGNADAVDVVISDNNGTPADPADDFVVEIGRLAAGAETTQSYDREITPQDPGTVTNTASVSGTDENGNPVPVVEDPAAVVVPPAPIPGVEVTKTALRGHDADCATATEGTNEQVVGETGEPITWCFMITNTGGTHLANLTIADELVGLGDNLQPDGLEGLILPPGGVIGFQVNATISADGVVNTVSVAGTPVDADGNPVINPSTGTPLPMVTADNDASNDEFSIDLEKTVLYGADRDCAEATEGTNELAVGIAGDPITWCFRIINTGSVSILVDEVVDDMIGVPVPVPADQQVIAPGASTTVSAPGQISESVINNTASVSGIAVTPDGQPIIDPETGQPLSPVETSNNASEGPAILVLTKTVLLGADRDCSEAVEGVNELAVGENGDPITWCFTVGNEGASALSNILFSDSTLGIVNQPIEEFITVDGGGLLILQPGASETFAAAGTIIDGGAVNTASTVADPVFSDGRPIPDAPQVSDENTAVINEISVELVKYTVLGADVDCSTADQTAAEALVGNLGDPFSYCFSLTNTGNIPITVNQITDVTLGVTVQIPPDEQVIAVDATIFAEIEETITDDLQPNVACVAAVAVGPEGEVVVGGPNPDDPDAVCDQAPPPSVLPTDLTIEKTSPSTNVDVGAVIDYTLEVTNLGPGNATNVEVTDVLPVQLMLVIGSATGDGWDCATSTAIKLVCTRASLDANTSSTLTFQATVGTTPPNVSTQIRNTSSVETETMETNLNNNSDDHVVTVFNEVLEATPTPSPTPRPTLVPPTPVPPTPVPPTLTPVPPTPTPRPPTPTPVPKQPQKLAITGSDSSELALYGLGAVVLGAGLMVIGRRRETDEQ